MIRKIYFALGLCLLLLADYAAAACPPALEQPTPEAVQAALRNARDHGFLWRISKEGRTSYLYGTIHVAKFEWMFPGPQVTMAINASDTVALEMDMLDTNIQAEVSKGMAALRGAAMPASLEKRLRQQAAEFCVSYDAIAKLSPELQVTALTMMVGRKAGLEAEYAIDAMLAGIGHREKKNMVSLETPELQLHVLQMDNEAETQAFVAESLDELEKGRALTMLERVAKAWASADYAELEHYEDWCECLNTGIEREMMKRALDERNPALAGKIDALHTAGKQVFAAVGSLHMFGALGLPVLMEKLGYKVERVNLKRL